MATPTQTTVPINLAPDEKTAQVMIYTPASLFWGDIVVKQMIRISTWLRTNTVPDRLCLINAKALVTNTGSTTRPPVSFSELYVSVTQIQAFHLIPPAKDPIDFDPSEPNRKMEPVNALVGSFHIKGFIRISANGNLKKFLEVNRESYTAVYDAEISNLITPSMGNIAVPFLLVRQETAVFTAR
jgi:hypothetical protein